MQPNAKDLLDNIMWSSLTGPHAQYAAGEGDARRYAKGFFPIVRFKDTARPDLAALISFCETGESFCCDIWSDPAPDGWRIDKEATMFKMVWEGVMPASDEVRMQFLCARNTPRRPSSLRH